VTTDRPQLWAGARVVGLTVVLAAVFSLAGLPSAVLFASLAAGMAHALTSSVEVRVPAIAFRVAQALIGVTIGAVVDGTALRRMGADAVPILLVTLGTVLVSLAAGWLLARRDDVTQVTGAFALIAGGASGVVATARDLGADDRVVTVVQYLRVLLVLVTLPLVTTLVFRSSSGGGPTSGPGASLAADLAYTALAVVVGLAVARVVPVPTGTLLVPMAIAAGLTTSGVLGSPAAPTALQWLAFALIGVQVGLRFTRPSLAAIVRMLPAVTAIIVGMIAVTALMGWVLALVTPVDQLTAYLATTPGGLFAVLAIATDSGSDATYVLAVQLFRILVILLSLPLLARWLRRRGG
jgi:membrane AbrB-like protein